MQKNIIAIVGQNENDALAVAARDVMALMKPFGFDGHVVSLYDANWSAQFNDIVRAGIVFVWANAGVGARMYQEGKIVWDVAKIPFISVLADQPGMMPDNHHINSRYVANGYSFKDYFDLQRNFIKSPQMSFVVPHGLVPNPHRDKIPWSKRPRRMVFLKSGGDPEACRRGWQNFPALLRAVIEESIAEILRRPTGDINPIIFSILENSNINVSRQHDIYYSIIHEVDTYIRQYRSTLMTKALCRVPADIIGARWDHIDQSAARARFYPAINAGEVAALMAETQYVVNTTPNFSSGSHERVPNAFAAKACIITDNNDYTRSRFSGLPTYFGFDWTDPNWPDMIVERFEDQHAYDDELTPALEFGAEEFDGLKMMRALLEIAEVIRFGERTTHKLYSA